MTRGGAFPTAAAVELKFVVRETRTMLALGDSGPVPLLMAVRQGEVTPPCAEVNCHQGCLEHPPAHLPHSPSCKEAMSSSLYAHRHRRLELCGQRQLVLLMLNCCLDFAAALAQPSGAWLASLRDPPLCWSTSPPSMELVIAESWLPLVASPMGTETPSTKMM
jgi:hypothetical protein